MDDFDARLRRRAALYRQPSLAGADTIQTAEYLKRVQDDTASFAAASAETENIDGVGPAYLRNRARHFRELAAQQGDKRRAQLFLDLAATLEKHAALREKRSTAQ